ncbi:hypothetical protein M501DRAFT_1007938 [Patellaria atrata CBS 101060]|uniref:Rhodopsin domain-containing protein n=1 Tax=Patellaria atrata CBS 101060 TaxID=1346257 RepID=A0A9P4SHQ4_9PEZI|nr:hypothetical protein M501DRAFT_1007938 [Patellaria atrata CBS 101060]
MSYHFNAGRNRTSIKDDEAYDDPEVLLGVEIPLMVLATIAVGLRVYSRIAVKRKLAADDILIVCGLTCAFGRTVISCMSANDGWGFDVDGPQTRDELPYYRHIFERRIAYIFAVTLIRFSVLAYYLRIFPPGIGSLRIFSWTLLVGAFFQFVAVFTILLVFCREIPKLWQEDFLAFNGSKCFSSPIYSFSAAIGDSVLDSLIFALPIPYVWRLVKIRTAQRIGLVIIFALGFTVCIVALLQIPFIKRRAENSTYFGGVINLLVAIQLSFAIIAASLPDLRAFIARSTPELSPLHHRSFAISGSRPHRDLENASPEFSPEAGRNAFDTKRRSRTPDWMRSTLPESLLSTRRAQVSILDIKPEQSNYESIKVAVNEDVRKGESNVVI